MDGGAISMCAPLTDTAGAKAVAGLWILLDIAVPSATRPPLPLLLPLAVVAESISSQVD